MSDTVAWGIVGTGLIARALARAIGASTTSRLVAVGSRTQGSADAFGDAYGVPARHASYEALVEDPAVEVVYVSTPHSMHAEWTIRAAEAGKHVLCEKAFALNHAEASRMVEAARRHDVFLMEAFMYRCHPQTHRIRSLVREGTLGEVRLVQANHGFFGRFDPEHRVFRHESAGGGILDVGCYCMSGARLVAGLAAGRDFAEPMALSASGTVGTRTRVDEWATATLEFAGGLIAQLACGIQLRMTNDLRVYGTEAMLEVPNPWGPKPESTMTLRRQGVDEPETIRVEAGTGLFTIEVDRVAELVRAGSRESPDMSLADTLGNMRALDRWRAEIGMVYDMERPGGPAA